MPNRAIYAPTGTIGQRADSVAQAGPAGNRSFQTADGSMDRYLQLVQFSTDAVNKGKTDLGDGIYHSVI